MINKIKEEIKNQQGKVLHFRFNGLRNQIEEFEGVIVGTYNYIFNIRTCENRDELKYFTYSDVLIDHLEIYK